MMSRKSVCRARTSPHDPGRVLHIPSVSVVPMVPLHLLCSPRLGPHSGRLRKKGSVSLRPQVRQMQRVNQISET